MSAVQNDRPTFDTYWRKNKEHTATKSLVFVVQSDPGRPSTKASGKPEDSEQSAKDKRRAQVRRAQNQHRARKANYTRQLEADIISIREKIEDVERDRCTLETENQVIRAQLCEPQQQQQQAAPDYGQVAEGLSIYTTPTAYSRGDTMSYGSNSDSADLEYFDVGDPSLGEMLGKVYYGDGSSAVGSGMYSSLSYGSGSNTPYVPLPDMSSLDQSGQILDYVSRFP